MPHALPPSGAYYTIYPESPDDLFDPEVDWREDLDIESPGDVFLSTDGAAHAVMNGLIPFNKLRNFCLYALGYAAAATGPDGDGVWRMYRINPPSHPIFPQLRVKSVSIRGFEPRSEEGSIPASPPPSPPPAVPWFPYPADDNLPGAQDLTPVGDVRVWGGTFDQPTDTVGARMFSMRPRRAGEDFGGGVAATDDRAFIPLAFRTTRYESARVTVEFHQPTWPVVEDSDPNFDKSDESDRNVFWTTEPCLDVLSLEGGPGNGLFFREGTTVSGGTNPPVASNIPGATSSTAVLPPESGFRSPTGILDPTMMDVATWVGVATRFIFDENLIPTKILKVLGRINSVDWLGYAAGTALLIGVTFQPVVWPIHSVDHFVVQLWTVKLHIKVRDPKRDDDANLTPDPSGAGKRGWVLFPRDSGFSYYATRFNGRDLYESVDFKMLFEHRQA